MNIKARIYWDAQDPRNVGWAWATRIDGEHDDTGPLDVAADASDEMLIAALRSELTTEASGALADDDIEIVK